MLDKLRHQCEEYHEKVNQCHSQYGKLDEDCVREELEQKRCLAELLCTSEAERFYSEKVIPSAHLAPQTIDERNVVESKDSPYFTVSCSTVLEAFAKPENEMLIPEGITKDDRDFCRRVSHELTACLGKKKILSNES